MDRIKLSFNKLIKLLEDNKLAILKIYTTDNYCRFLELRNNRTFKLFYMYVPEKYEIPYDDKLCKLSPEDVATIYQVDRENATQKKYIQIIDCEGLKCDIISISNKFICYRNVEMNNYMFYNFGELDEETDENIEEGLPKEHTVKELEARHKALKLKTAKSEEYKFVNVEPTGPPKEEVDMVFEDEEGNSLDDLNKVLDDVRDNIHIDKHTVVEVNVSEKKEGENDTNSDAGSDGGSDAGSDGSSDAGSDSDSNSGSEGSLDSEGSYHINVIEPEQIDEDIEIGTLNICVTLNLFFKIMHRLDDFVDEMFNELENKETISRENKMRNIEEVLAKFKVFTFDKLDEIHHKELEINKQVKRLSSVLVSCDKMIKRELKPSDEKDVREVEQRTKNTIKELTLEKLKLRDEASKILNHFHHGIERMCKY